MRTVSRGRAPKFGTSSEYFRVHKTKNTADNATKFVGSYVDKHNRQTLMFVSCESGNLKRNGAETRAVSSLLSRRKTQKLFFTAQILADFRREK
jgi:hypothetical protein